MLAEKAEAAKKEAEELPNLDISKVCDCGGRMGRPRFCYHCMKSDACFVLILIIVVYAGLASSGLLL